MASPRRFRSALRTAVRRSLASRRALRAVICKLTGRPCPDVSTEPLIPSVPGPALPCKLLTRIVLPAASTSPLMSVMWTPSAKSWIAASVNRAPPLIRGVC